MVTPRAQHHLLRGRAEHRTHIAFVVPALAVYVTFALLPLLINVWYSFTDWSAFSTAINFVGTRNYTQLFSDREFWHSLRVTLVFVGLVVPLQLGLGLLTAVTIARQSWFTGVTRLAVLVPLALSPIATGLLFNLFMSPSVGIVPQVFGPEVTLQNPPVAIGVVVFAQVWSNLGISTFIFLAAVIAIPQEYYEAAAIDGAGPVNRFVRITLPLLRGAAAVNAIYTVATSFRSFGLILALTDGGPLGATRVLSILLYRKSFGSFELGYGSAIATTLVVIIAFISLLPAIGGAIRRKLNDGVRRGQ